MARGRRIRTRYQGVYYREDPKRRVHGKPDRYYVVRFRAHGKLREIGVGWASEGVTAAEAKRVLEQEMSRAKEALGAADAPPTLAEFVEHEYVPWARTNKRSWKTDVGRFRTRLLPELGHLQLNEITTARVERFKTDLLGAGLSPATVTRYLALLRAVLNKAEAWGKTTARPFEPGTGVRPPRTNNARTRFLTQGEATKLLDALRRSSPRTHDQAVLGLYAGLRFGEIVRLTWGDVDFENRLLHVRDPKSGRAEQVPMNEQVVRVLRNRHEDAVHRDRANPSDPVFPDRSGKPQRYISSAFARAVQRLGLNRGVTDPRQKVVFHTLRHTFASWLVMRGVPLYTVQKLMRHRSYAMTERYAHLAPDSTKEAVTVLDDG